MSTLAAIFSLCGQTLIRANFKNRACAAIKRAEQDQILAQDQRFMDTLKTGAP
jgi:hypothetical protein